MARKNFGVAMGRPPKTAAARMPKPPKAPTGGRMPAPMGATPMDSFSPGLPAASFNRGGRVGYSSMPHHHDDPAHRKPKCS